MATSEGIRLFPPLVPLTGIALGAGLDLAWPLDVPTALRWAGWVLAALGLAWMLWAIMVQVRGGTDPNPFGKTEALVVGGPYAVCRNPIYLGDLCLQAGISLGAGWPWGIALVPVSMWVLWRFVIRKEEAHLAEVFGDAYAAYRARVRRWL